MKFCNQVTTDLYFYSSLVIELLYRVIIDYLHVKRKTDTRAEGGSSVKAARYRTK